MATSTTGFQPPLSRPELWSRSPSPSHSRPRDNTTHTVSPDLTLPRYPDRLIRPLPKRTLRSRLSDEAARRIQDEFAPPPSTDSGGSIFGNVPYVDRSHGGRNNGSRTNGSGRPVSAEESARNVRFLGAGEREMDEHHVGHTCRCGQDHGVRDMAFEEDDAGLNAHQLVTGPGSATSSADGYESFENTNNKKKRKIPGAMGGHGAHVSTSTGLSKDMSTMSLSNSTEVVEGPIDESQPVSNASVPATQHYVHASGTGISGAGRGRFGRPKHENRAWMERKPLATSLNGGNVYKTLGAKGKREWPSEDQGIISAAIASAQEAATRPSLRGGSDTMKSLMQQTSKVSATPSLLSQFTFSMDSESSKALYNTQAALPPPPTGHVPPPPNHYSKQQQPGGAPPPANGSSNSQQKQLRPRKPLSRLYTLAARQRRLQQEYQNFHHPPTQEEVWICEFCEYEAIFGMAPAALVRQYEEKDRKERKRLAEKRRLLEKAKMKGRKGRKGGKKNKKNNATAAQDAGKTNDANYDNKLDRDQYEPTIEGDVNDDEFFDDEYEDDILSGGAPPPPTPTKELQDGGRVGVSAGGSGGNGAGGGGTPAGVNAPAKLTSTGKPMGRTRRA